MKRLTMMQRIAGVGVIRLIVVAAMAAGCGGCMSLERNPNVVSPYSDKLSAFNYKEDGSLASLVVGVEGARFIRKEAYFPLFVQVGNKSKVTFTITREAFTLEDPLGRQYSIAPAREVAENYGRLDLDRRLFVQNRQFTATGVGLMTHIPSDFYPSSARRSLLIEQLILPPHGFMEDVIYFPIPESGLNGVPLRLLFKVKEIDEPIQVVFEVPRTLGILEKDKDDEEKP
ncbi:MAG TPA: hypothetical protein VGV60_02490 [Candidatus Polarisedimenticolia bacterium]|jgi:hypothetical protein|nr:hypothetical protein [Candidatus Polarisedimenticolia bacterium]